MGVAKLGTPESQNSAVPRPTTPISRTFLIHLLKVETLVGNMPLELHGKKLSVASSKRDVSKPRPLKQFSKDEELSARDVESARLRAQKLIMKSFVHSTDEFLKRDLS